MKGRLIACGAAAVLLLSTVLATAGPAASASSPRSFGGPGSVPWASVGRGWLAASWTPSSGRASHATYDLVLVAPTGARYLLKTLPNEVFPASWSGDGQRLLLAGGSSKTIFEIMDLRTQALLDRFVFPTSNNVFYENAEFTRPDGFAIDVSTQTNDHQLLTRYSLSGALELTYPASFSHLGAFTGSWVPSPSGTELVMGAQHGLAVLSNNGAVLRDLPSPKAGFCQPQRWWSATVVLARCGTGTSRLYEFNIAGGAPKALTQRPVPPDDGDLSAWHVGRSVYVQVASACGYIYLAKLKGADPVMVHVPGVSLGKSVLVDGTTSTAIAVQASVACQAGDSLLWYTPAGNSSHFVLGPPATAGSVGGALIYPTPLG